METTGNEESNKNTDFADFLIKMTSPIKRRTQNEMRK